MSPPDSRRQLGQFVMLGFDGFQLPAELRSLARDFDLGGIVLFKRNVESPEQVAELAFESARLCQSVPTWVAVDQEGGRVARMRRPFTEWPPMAALGRSGDEALARRFARAIARELASVGITLDFAPVLDVLTNAANPAIGELAQMYEYDLKRLDLGDEVARAIDHVEMSIGSGELPAAIRNLTTLAQQSIDVFNRREEVILGNAQ